MEKEAPSEEPRLKGALRGLDLSNLLEATQESVEADKESSVDIAPRYETRAARNGKVQVNYSMKYHPMDGVTRPKRAKRITDSPSLSASKSRRLENETSSESDPDLRSGSSDEGGDDASGEGLDGTIRMPDPNATRHSMRSEAQKLVNYSRAHHPQDHSLPGYQHLAKRKRKQTTSSRPQKKQKRDEFQISSDTESINCSSDEAQVQSDAECITGAGSRTPAPNKNGPRTKSGNCNVPSSTQAAPALRKDEYFNPVEAILQGHHFASPGKIDQASDQHTRSGSENEEDAATTTQLGLKPAELLANIDISAACSSSSTVVDPLSLSQSADAINQSLKTNSSTRSQKSEARSMLQAPSYATSHTAPAPSQPVHSRPPAFAIIRPYMSSRSVSSTTVSSATIDHAKAQNTTDGSTLPQRYHVGCDKESQVVAHEDTIQEPTASSASEGASSWTAINRAISQRSICSSNASQQTSRGTLTNENVDSGSLFEAEMDVTQRLSQRDPEDDLPQSTATEYSDLLVSPTDECTRSSSLQKPKCGSAGHGRVAGNEPQQ